MRLANMRNGLAFPYDDICYFQSQYGHHKKNGYFNGDAMPPKAVLHLILGGSLTVVDATRRHKLLTDAQKFGIPTWCGVFNRALGFAPDPTCDWWTRDMSEVVRECHHRVKQMIRKLSLLYRNGDTRAAIVGENIILECHQGFDSDDNIKRLWKRVR